ncbi:MAG: iron ABC transporter permease [Corynebacterium casei]|nr:iron ABC transporter permease [Corynebacterium casei]
MMSPASKQLPWKGPRVLRLGSLSFRINLRMLLLGAIAIVGSTVVTLLAVMYGDIYMSPAAIREVLAGEGTPIERRIVIDLRLGRAIVALLVGACLSMAGALTQSVARNPLASPDIIGITSGAALAAALAIVLSGDVSKTNIGGKADSLLKVFGLPGVALLGASLAALTVVVLTLWRGGTMIQFILIGVGVSIFLSSVTTWLLAWADLETARQAKIWLTGSLNGRDFHETWAPSAVLLLSVMLAGWVAFKLSALALGETVAYVLGHSVRLAQGTQILVAIVLTAVAVSVAGPIGFVAFVVPHLARIASRTSTPPLMLSVLFGAFLLGAADFIARAVIPWEIPVGIITSLVGAPILLYMTIRMVRRVTIV